jgi:EAL domain-containing protein (putative c-di-GMP-specific phosphodiesterase class I)/AmiR/NasT family two-component response regulator
VAAVETQVDSLGAREGRETQERAATSAIADLHFLVAEDQRVQRILLVRVLEALGAKTIYETADGREAMKIIEDSGRPVDIVITDLDMPGMDGLEFLRRLSELGRRRISVILTTAMGAKLLASVGAMTKAYGLALLGVLEKPLTPGKLAPLINLHKHSQVQLHEAAAAGPAFALEEIVEGLKSGQFEPYYQPQMDVASGRVNGAEALARWRHPEHGVIAPASFIPILERAAQLNQLTFLMLKKAAAACRAWRDSGLDLKVAVNLSLVSLADTTLADRIVHAVRAEGLEPRHMVLEITETAAMTEVAPALENLARLRMRGFGLSVDDYGTGFSSLRQLTRVPFTELKIDRSFVTGCAQNPLSRAMVDSSVEMARRLEIESIAEGVETQSDWNALQAAGCLAAQGYFLAKPMEGQLFLEYCLTNRAR